MYFAESSNGGANSQWHLKRLQEEKAKKALEDLAIRREKERLANEKARRDELRRLQVSIIGF